MANETRHHNHLPRGFISEVEILYLQLLQNAFRSFILTRDSSDNRQLNKQIDLGSLDLLLSVSEERDFDIIWYEEIQNSV